jgi:murein DD-endopeptidase MepM/ murein hydrolase activator NlpD
MVVKGRGAVIVLDDGGPDSEDLVERVQGVWPEVYRMTDHDEPDAAEHVINVGSKHLNMKTLVRQMYEEQAYFAVVPQALDPVKALSDLLSAARGYLADGFPAFVVVSARPGRRYRRIAAVLDPTEPITTGSLALAAVALAWRTGADFDALLLGGDPDNPPDTFNDVREMFRIGEGAEMLQQASELANEHGIRGGWRALGEAASRDQLVLDAVRSGDYDLVVDDLRPIDVGPRIGRQKRVHRQLVEGDSIDTCYRLLRDAPCDVAVVVDAVRMRLIPPAYAKGAAVAARSIGLLGAAARPAAASDSSSTAPTTSIEAPLDPSAEAADAEEVDAAEAETEAVDAAEAETEAVDAAEAETEAAAQEEATATPAAPVGTPAPTGDQIPEEVSAEQLASYEQSAAQEQATLQAEQAELATLQQQQATADRAVSMAQTDLAIAQQDLAEAESTQESTEAALQYAEDSRNTLTEDEVNQTRGSANRASYDVGNAQDAVAEAEEALQQANAEAAAAAEATAAQQSVVDAQAQNVAAWNDSVAEADTRTDQRVAPVEGYSVTTTYGVAGSNWSSGYHTGSDYAAPSGTTVMAAASGTVTAAGFNGPYGNQITVQHEDGTETTYSHLSEISVSVGDTVSAGEAIGAVGTTGNSTGPHLHFEAFDAGGERMNPEVWLGQA